MATQSNKPSEEIELWLIDATAKLLGVSPTEVKPDEQLALLGLNSLEAMSLSGELSNWLQKDIAPTIVWDYPTIRELSNHIASLD